MVDVPLSGEAALAAVQAELFNEKMEALGRVGRKAHAALAALAASTGDPHDQDHRRLLEAASSSVWAFIVQRELCGLPGAAHAIRDLDVPPAVMARLGVSRRG